MLVHRLRRWPSIKPTLAQRIMIIGTEESYQNLLSDTAIQCKSSTSPPTMYLCNMVCGGLRPLTALSAQKEVQIRLEPVLSWWWPRYSSVSGWYPCCCCRGYRAGLLLPLWSGPLYPSEPALQLISSLPRPVYLWGGISHQSVLKCFLW